MYCKEIFIVHLLKPGNNTRKIKRYTEEFIHKYKVNEGKYLNKSILTLLNI